MLIHPRLQNFLVRSAIFVLSNTFVRPMEADKTTHQFKPNSRFEDAVALYNFDIELRGLQQTIKDTRLSQSSLKYLARRYIYL